MNIKKLHYFSGITITIFIGVHLLNHFISVFGVEAHIDLMNTLRIVYRNVMVETILLTAVIVQIISGVKLFFQSRKSSKNFYRKLQIWAGLYLAFFLLVHVGAVLVGRYILNLDTNFYFGVAGLNTFPFNLFFIPYYGLGVISFFGHIAGIHFMKMKKEIFGLSIKRQSNLLLIVGVVFTLIILYGLTNSFAGFEIPSEYDILIGK